MLRGEHREAETLELLGCFRASQVGDERGGVGILRQSGLSDRIRDRRMAVGGESADAESSTTPYFGPLDESWLIANTVSGDMEGFYNAPEGFTGSTLCYLGQRSFLYYTVKDKQPFLMEADQ